MKNYLLPVKHNESVSDYLGRKIHGFNLRLIMSFTAFQYRYYAINHSQDSEVTSCPSDNGCTVSVASTSKLRNLLYSSFSICDRVPYPK